MANSKENARKAMVIFFVIGTSDSMHGDKIGTVNTAIEEIILEIEKISRAQTNAQIKIATLEFSTGARWIDKIPITVEDYHWDYLEAGGGRDFGEACLQLNEKLSQNAFMCEENSAFAPAIFLMTDGSPTDNYRYGLEKLKQNDWFKNAIKVAIAIGSDANKSVLTEFTGNIEATIEAHGPEELKKWIQFIKIDKDSINNPQKQEKKKMERNRREANVMIAKCKQARRTFGIRVEKKDDLIWHCTWAFKIDEKAASHEGYEETVISGQMTLDPEYPGCPYCGSPTWFTCGSCGKITCQGAERVVTCAWCGNTGETTVTDTVNLRGGNY